MVVWNLRCSVLDVGSSQRPLQCLLLRLFVLKFHFDEDPANQSAFVDSIATMSEPAQTAVDR